MFKLCLFSFCKISYSFLKLSSYLPNLHNKGVQHLIAVLIQNKPLAPAVFSSNTHTLETRKRQELPYLKGV